MEHLLFAGYLILFAWLVTRVKFFTRSGLTPAQLIIIFLLKVMAGIIYGWIGIYYGNLAQMVDTWSFHYNSLQEFRVLTNSPRDFFGEFFKSSYPDGYSGFLGRENSWWNDIDIKLITKLLAFFNIFSTGHYYINIIFYSFFTLFGPIALYRVMNHYFPDAKIAILISVFLIPSFLYWTSGIHKEGPIFMAVSLIIYCFYFGFLQNRMNWKKIVVILFSLLLLLVLRNYLLIAIVPALLAWVVANRSRFHPLAVYGSVYFFFVALFFTAQYINPKLDFPSAVVDKQQQFLKLKGNSFVPTTSLEPNLGSFVSNAPQAINLSLIRPYPTDVNHLLSMAAAVEINLLLMIIVIFLLWHRPAFSFHPFILFCIFFSVSVLMTIGYTVNFLGAIVRYRSIIFPLLFVPLIAKVKWDKIGDILLNIKTKNNI